MHFKLFSNPPPRNNRLNYGVKLFRPAVQEYLLSHSCYRFDEFTSTESSYMVYENTCNIFFCSYIYFFFLVPIPCIIEYTFWTITY
jgi:hypothetical protein